MSNIVNGALTFAGVWGLIIAANIKSRMASKPAPNEDLIDKCLRGFYKAPNMEHYKYILEAYKTTSPGIRLKNHMMLWLGAVLENYPSYNGNSPAEKSLLEKYGEESPHLLDYPENLADFRAGAIDEVVLAGVLDNNWMMWFATGDRDYPKLIRAIADDQETPAAVKAAANWSYNSIMRDVPSEEESEGDSDDVEALLRGGGGDDSTSSTYILTPTTDNQNAGGRENERGEEEDEEKKEGEVAHLLTDAQQVIRAGFIGTLRLMQSHFDPSYGPSLFSGEGDGNALWYRNHGTAAEQEQFNRLLGAVVEITEHPVEEGELTAQQLDHRNIHIDTLRAAIASPERIQSLSNLLEGPQPPNMQPASWYLAHGTAAQIEEFNALYRRYIDARTAAVNVSSSEAVQHDLSDTDDDEVLDDDIAEEDEIGVRPASSSFPASYARR
jgi:hypothetical protein